MAELSITDGTYRVTGVPGGGKTTFLIRQIKRAIQTHGVGNIAVVSFTNTAATEIATRAGEVAPLSKNQVGTLHSFAFHALGTPQLIEDPKGLKQWNEWIERKDPRLKLSSASTDTDDLTPTRADETLGDSLHAEMNILRNKLKPTETWRQDVQWFAKQWNTYKEEVNGIDFTDMLELAIRDVDHIPWSPAVGIMDEAQDSSRLVLSLWDKWSKSMDFNILAGDSDQCIFSFAGVDVGAFLELNLPDSHKKYFLESTRCPRAVTEYANRIIKQCKYRDPIEMLPRDADGEYRRIHGDLKYPEDVLRDAEPYLKEGKTVAFLTTCAYMLSPLLSVLRQNAIPFENRYRRKRGDWNPLFSARGTTTADKILCYANGGERWSIDQLKKWLDLIEAKGVLAHGAKAGINSSELTEVNLKQLAEWFAPCWPEPAMQELEWLERHLLASKSKTAQYPLAIAKKHGLAKLRETPQITVGTIHSVKGATFDVVYLFPDLSIQAMQTYLEDKDSILRCWYVGATRAMESLIICSASTRLSIDEA